MMIPSREGAVPLAAAGPPSAATTPAREQSQLSRLRGGSAAGVKTKGARGRRSNADKQAWGCRPLINRRTFERRWPL